MTVVVLWYRERYASLWCAADSRLSKGEGVLTDNGAKILPVPVVCYKTTENGRWVPDWRHEFGFAFAGSSLSAISTHAIATACTQSLAQTRNEPGPPSLLSVTKIFHRVAKQCMLDMAGRMGVSDNPEACFFDGVIFGYCPTLQQFKGYAFVPNTMDGELKMIVGDLSLPPGRYHLLGGGEKAFLDLHAELERKNPDHGVMKTLSEMVKRDATPGVGGYVQVGVSDMSGFRLKPMSVRNEHDSRHAVRFLGFNVDSMSDALDGYRIGFEAIGPD